MSIIFELHECVEMIHFCGVQSLVIVDLASLSSIAAFANQADHELEGQYILLENAGIVTREYEQVDQCERSLLANNVGPGLLAVCMVRKMVKIARKHSSRDWPMSTTGQ